jgi:dolichyl-diphosphooligosaccharide--protein glycosyltransferase
VRPIALFAVVVVLATVPRMSNVAGTFRDSGVVLGGEDSYYHMRRIELALDNGGVIPPVDRYVNYPEGALLDWPPGFDLTLAGITAFVRSVWPAPSPAAVCSVAIAIIGALTAGLTALLARARGANGWAAGLLVAGMAAHIDYTQIGRVDHHVLEPLMVLAPLAAVPSMDDRLRWSVAAAVAALSAAFWPGSVVLVPAVVATLLVAAGIWRTIAWGTAVRAVGVGFVTSVVLSLSSRWTWEHRAVYYALSGFQPIVWGAAWGLVLACARLRREVAAVAIGVSTLVAIAASHDTLGHALSYLMTTEAQISTVHESESLWHRGALFATRWLSPLVWIAPLAVLAVLRTSFVRRDAYSFALGAIAATTGFLAVDQVRFGSLFTVPFALAVATLAGSLLSCAIVAIAALFSAWPFLGFQPYGLPQPEEAADVFAWLRDVAPPTRGFRDGADAPEYSVLSGWGWGHWVTYLGHKANIANPLGQTEENLRGVRRAAEILLATDPREALARAETLGVRYVLATMPEREIDGLALQLGMDPATVIDWSRSPPALEDGYLRSFDYALYGEDALVPVLADRVRLVFEGSASRPFVRGSEPYAKVFEIVRGVELVVQTDTSCILRQEIVGASRALVRHADAAPDGSGVVRFRVPYATSGVIRGGVAVVTCGGTSILFSPAEADVLEGRILRGTAP